MKWKQRLNAQAKLLSVLAQRGVISQDLPWLDFGAGDGSLSRLCAEKGISLFNYDRYLGSKHPDYLRDDALKPGAFQVVVNTSVFEHVVSREPLDEMVHLLAEDGVLATHTWVSRTIPRNPSWFYLLPVHTAFYSNESMARLMKQWRFDFSAYHIPSELWLFFHEGELDRHDVWNKVADIGGMIVGSSFVNIR